MEKININIYADKEKKEQGDLFGIFFEDLDHAADGGLYGELVRNRSFEFDKVDSPEYHAMTAWSLVERGDSVAQAHVETTVPLNRNDRSGMYRWKNTVGTVEERPARRNTWNYNQTFGLGFYEFFCFCEMVGAELLPVIAAGYDPHYLRKADLEDMQEWIDEALDLIEFANGSAETEWGSVAGEDGTP